MAHTHPLQLLNDKEIRTATEILTKHISSSITSGALTDNKIHFKNVSLHDPPKALLLPYLDAEAAGLPPAERGYVPRCVDITWSVQNGRKVTESTISLDAQAILAEIHAAKGQHGPNDRYAYSFERKKEYMLTRQTATKSFKHRRQYCPIRRSKRQ